MVALTHVFGLLASVPLIFAAEPAAEKNAASTFGDEKVGLIGPEKVRGCHKCRQVWCDLTICFNDHENPALVVNEAFAPKISHYNDGGALTSWARTNAYCNGGLRKATGVFKIWRVPCKVELYDVNVDYAGAKGKVSARCHTHDEIEVSHC